MRRTGILAALILVGSLAACGDTIGEQAVIGTGAGAVTAMAVDGNPLLGAAVGAGANIVYCQQNPGEC